MEIVEVEVEQIKVGGVPKDLIEEDDVMHPRVLTERIEPQGVRAGGDQTGLGHGIATGEQGHLMALTDEFLGEIGHHAFGAAIVLGWHPLIERGNLRNAHTSFLSHRSLGSRHAARSSQPPSCRSASFLYRG